MSLRELVVGVALYSISLPLLAERLLPEIPGRMDASEAVSLVAVRGFSLALGAGLFLVAVVPAIREMLSLPAPTPRTRWAPPWRCSRSCSCWRTSS